MAFDLKKWWRKTVGKDTANAIDKVADAMDLKGQSRQAVDAALEEMRKQLYGYAITLGISEPKANKLNLKFMDEKNKLLEKVF